MPTRRSLASAALVLGTLAVLTQGPPSASPLVYGAARCDVTNPLIVATCHPVSTRITVAAGGTRVSEGYLDPNSAAVVAFTDTPSDTPQYRLASISDVGSTWGVAYRAADHAVFVGAFHKRQVPFGPGGPGAIYRIDMLTGVHEVFATVPNAGPDLHGRSNGPDTEAKDGAGKIGLGDLDLSDDGRYLFTVNLHDRLIYALDASDGSVHTSFAHGASQEEWAAEARPFGLAVHQGQLYHGVVRTAESTQRRGDLAAFVYRSGLDGSAMEQVAHVGLDHTRGRLRGIAVNNTLLDWLPWRPPTARSRADARKLDVFPQPILVDLEIDRNGRLTLGFHDRHLDTTLRYVVVPPGARGMAERPGFGTGDLLYGLPTEDGWTFDPAKPHYNERNHNLDRAALGGLALLGDGRLVASAFVTAGVGGLAGPKPGVLWFESNGSRDGHEGLCSGQERRSLPPLPLSFGSGVDGATGSVSMSANERVRPSQLLPRAAEVGRGQTGGSELLRGSDPLGGFSIVTAGTVGDVAAVCPSDWTPSATPPPSVTPTLTPTPPPTATATTEPTSTPLPRPVYLPLLLAEPRCVPGRLHNDVVMVLDASGSMRELTRGGRTKLEAAREAAGVLLSGLSLNGTAAEASDQAALVTFHAQATLLIPLNSDRSELESALQTYESGALTRIDLGLAVGLDELRSPRRRDTNRPVMILLTDGRNNPEPVETAIAVAAAVKQNGIRLFTIGLGEEVDAAALAAMASASSDYFYAPDGDDLGDIFERLARVLPCAAGEYWGRR